MATTLNNENLAIALQSLGLTNNEVKVYLANLELGATSIWEISQKSGIKRPTCYDILEVLSIRGFASSSNDGKRIIYSVASPKQLMQIEERRHKKVVGTFNELEALANSETEKPSVRQFIGKKGIEEALNLVFLEPKGTEILVYGSTIFFADPIFYQEFTEKRKKHNIKIRLIYSDTAKHREILLRDNADELREIKFIPESDYQDIHSETCIFGDTMTFTSPGESEPYALVIESRAFAIAERQRFEMLWQMAKK
jgi:sugar-specific transcriptional regulator TrmB